MFKTPRLEIYLPKIKFNAEYIIKKCHDNNVKVAAVTKVMCGLPEVAQTLLDSGSDLLADSRLENIKRMRDNGIKSRMMLLRIPSVSEAYETVQLADISLNSMLDTVIELGRAAVDQNKIHEVILMIDVGDLREGVLPEMAPITAKQISEIEGIDLIGVGCNLACYGGVIPTEENMELLAETADKCRESTGLKLPVLCGGNSSGLPLMLAGRLPKKINMYRIGESIILGRNVLDRTPLPNTVQDTVKLFAEVIEVYNKPSVPTGQIAQNAFGEHDCCVDRGVRRRVICNIGRLDVLFTGLVTVDENMIILGASSDHLLLDVDDCDYPIKVGDEIAFYPDYGALLSLSASQYVRKVIC